MLTCENAVVLDKTRTLASLAHYQIIRRNGAVVPFEPNKISYALMKAFMGMHGVLALAKHICSGWLHGVWRAIKPSKVGAHTVSSWAGYFVPQNFCHKQVQSNWQQFFGSHKPDMRNAP